MIDYHELFEKLPDGVTLHDPATGAIIDANHQFCEMLGYSREELLTLDFDALHPDDPPYTSERATEYIRKAATDGPQTFEWVDLQKDGTPLPVEVHLRQTTIDGDQRILAVVRDISERKQRERELERKNERLEEFTSVVSHDLRNPLNMADGWLELAREDCDSDYLDNIEQAHDRMQILIEDLLSLAREGQSVGTIEPVDLAPTVKECWRVVDTADASLDIGTDATIHADRTSLKQLLENLMRNSVEHGGEDVTVTIDANPTEETFFVEDDGPGIPEDIRNRVFSPGYSSQPEGTGFGLAIVEEVADAHDWTVTVTDSSDGGARFEFTDVTIR